MKWSEQKLQSILEADPIAVNNFTQSTNSQNGPTHRDSVPPKGSLLRALHDKVDEIVTERTVRSAGASSSRVAPISVTDSVGSRVLKCMFENDLYAFLTISDMTAVAFVSTSKWANTPQTLRKVLAFRWIVVKFAWSRACDALIRQVTPRISQRLATVQAVYVYIEMTDKYPVPLFVATLPSDSRQNELVGPLGEFRHTFGFFICLASRGQNHI